MVTLIAESLAGSSLEGNAPQQDSMMAAGPGSSAPEAPPAVVAESRARAIVELPVSVDEVKAAFLAYDQVSAAILSDADFQEVTGARGQQRRIRAKSAWYRLAIAYNLTERDDLEKIVVDREPGTNRWVSVYARVVMQAPNGRVAVGHHASHITEKCCAASTGEACFLAQYEDHKCCLNGCSGRWHWNLPGDMVATAHTRAKARAIADLIGAGLAGDDDRTASRGQVPEPSAATPLATTPNGQHQQKRLYETGKPMTENQRARLLSLAKRLGFDCEYMGLPALAVVKVQGLNLPAGIPAIELEWLTRRQASVMISNFTELLRKRTSGKAGKG